MAEAAIDQQGDKFFCHECTSVINPTLPNYTCPRCDSGFIEEIEEDPSGPPEEPSIGLQSDTFPVPEDPAVRFEEIWGQTFLNSLTEHRDQINNRRAPEGSGSDADAFMAADGERDDPMMQRHPFRHGRIMFRRAGPRSGRNQAIESIVQQLLTGLTGGAMFGRTGSFPIGTMFNLYGNPGDYAWGAGGLDSIITQLLNQLDGTGPPPAPKDKIDNLPLIKITKELVDKTLQCSVCMEDFVIDERVRRLPCNHHYHSDCITPWLELHGTCPVCRKNLEGEDTTSGPAAGDPGIPNTDFLHQDPMEPSSSSSAASSSTRHPPRGGSSSNQFDPIDEYD